MSLKFIHTSGFTCTLLTLLFGLALAACGTSAPGDPSVSQASASGLALKLDSCALLTRDDAEALLGAPVAAPNTNAAGSDDPADERAMSQCLYHTTGDAYKSVSVLVRRGAVGEDARSALQQIRDSNVLGGAFEPVTGLGDAALWNHGGDADQLSVAKGQYLVIASADLGTGVPTLEISRAAAQRVLGRLPQ